ncbi:MAG: hypothetical protein ACRDK3_09235 [Actinomycetota bacterium]
MKVSDRFVDYGVTGGLFLLSQTYFLVIVAQGMSVDEWETWMSKVDAYLSTIPETLQASITTLLAVLGILSIFVIGLS